MAGYLSLVTGQWEADRMTLVAPLEADHRLDDAPRCEINHTVDDPCTVRAIAVVNGCAGSSLVCARAVREIEGHLDSRTCNVCGAWFRDCWRIIPF